MKASYAEETGEAARADGHPSEETRPAARGREPEGSGKEKKADFPSLENDKLLEGRGYKTWREFLEKEAYVTDEADGHKFYQTRSGSLKVIVGPDGSLMSGNAEIMEQAWEQFKEDRNTILKGGLWARLDRGARGRGR